MTTNTAGTTARQDPRQVVNTLKRTLNFNDSDVAQAAIGTLPSGNDLPQNAQVLDVTVQVVTAFNAATTNQLTLGTNSNSWNNFIVNTDVNLAATGVTSVKRGAGAVFTSGSDTALYAVFTQSGTAATAGQAIITVWFEGGYST